MLKLNRTTEYGLMALSYIRLKGQGELTSAREIADYFNLPFEILAKTLQRLKEQGIISSAYGTRGGYILARDLQTLNLAEFLKMMEGPVSVVACAHTTPQPKPVSTPCECEYLTKCNIKGVMASLNDRITNFLHHISVDELTRSTIQTSLRTPELGCTTLTGDSATQNSTSFAFGGEEP